jgi:hypothetical protein
LAIQDTIEFGGFGGNPFSKEYPKEVGLYHGEWINSLVLNGKQFGTVSNPTLAGC